jgi:hypothetical protein
LTGEVDNPRSKLAAESLARNTVGVTDVKNEIIVAPAKPIPDPTLKDRIVSALAVNPFTTVGEVKVAVKDGLVTLTGGVESHFESAQAEDVAAQFRGVRQVRNELAVKRPEKAYAFDAYLAPYAPAVSIWRYVPRTTAKADREIQREVVDELSTTYDSFERCVASSRPSAVWTPGRCSCMVGGVRPHARQLRGAAAHRTSRSRCRPTLYRGPDPPPSPLKRGRFASAPKRATDREGLDGIGG